MVFSRRNNGNEVITAGTVNYVIIAGDGRNVVDAGAGNNIIVTGRGGDTITAGNGNDIVNAGDGDNVIAVGDGRNVVNAGSGADTITTGNGDDVIIARDGDNLVSAGEGDNLISAGRGADRITTGAGDDRVNAGDGDNVVNAGGGDNEVLTGGGNDIITAGGGDDLIRAGNGDNVVNAGAGNNRVFGGNGRDVIVTLGGNDSLFGGNGGGVFSAGGGSDRAFGGTGNDVFIHRFSENAGASDIYDGALARDILRLEFTQAEWVRADVQADVARFLAHLDSALNQKLGAIGLATPFTFGSMGLLVSNIEALEVVVAGVAIDPRDALVSASADRLAMTEDTAATVDLLANDAVADRVASIELLTPSSLGTAILTRSLDGSVQTAALTFSTAAGLQSLRAGESRTENLTYRVTDADGDTATASVAITVTGVNDAASISGGSVGALEEGSGTVVQGKLSVADVDSGEASFRPAASLDGSYGSFSFNPATGEWHYSIDETRDAVQRLVEGQVVFDRLTVTSLDGTASREILVTLTGTNDRPVVTAATAAVAEDGDVSGSVSGLDADAGETATLNYALVSAAPQGLTFNADGTYSFDASGYGHLAEGVALTVFADFTATDAQGATSAPERLSITVTGTNDAPTVRETTVAVTEDQLVTGQIVGDDADADETASLRYELVSAAPEGFVLETDGRFSFDAASYDSLGEGEVQRLVVEVRAVDASGAASDVQTVNIDVTGVANDFIAQDVLISGRTLQNGSFASGLAGWTRNLEPESDPGAPQVNPFRYQGSVNPDMSGRIIPGDDDVVVLSIDAGLLGGAIRTFGNVFGPSLTSETFGASAGDSISLVYAKSDIFSLGSADPTIFSVSLVNVVTGLVTPAFFETLGDGGVRAVDVPIEADGLYQLRIRVGTVASEQFFGGGFTSGGVAIGSADIIRSAVVEGGQRAIDQAEFTDAALGSGDGGIISLASVVPVSALGAALSIDGSGRVVYDTSALDFLRAGERVTDTFEYTIQEASGITSTATASIVVVGRNDVPEVQGETRLAQEGQTLTGQIVATDADDGEQSSLHFATVGAVPAGFTLTETGGYTFAATTEYDSLRDGEVATYSVQVTATDVQGVSALPATLTFTVTGKNDVPVAIANGRSVSEDNTWTGTLLARDADAGETQSLTFSLAGSAPAGFVLNANGSYRMDASSYDSLASEEEQLERISFVVTDANGAVSDPATFFLRIVGMNDDAVITGTSTGSVIEDASPILRASGQLSVSDPDTNESAFVPFTNVAGRNSFGGFSITADGNWTYTTSSNAERVQRLQDGQKVVDSITVTSVDGTASRVLEVTIFGEDEFLIGTADDDSLLVSDILPTTIEGREGNDTLSGNISEDNLIGGQGSDVFLFRGLTNRDFISDFTSGVDRVAISASGFGAGLVEVGILYIYFVDDLAQIEPTIDGIGHFISLATSASTTRLYWDPTSGDPTDAIIIADVNGRFDANGNDFVLVA